MKDLFETHPGDSPVRMRFLSSQGITPLQLGTFRIDASGSLVGELRALLGSGAARVEQL
jgi:hypothetical protein